jgi:acyl dehydratase
VAAEVQELGVQPPDGEQSAGGRLGLRELVGVVDRDVVDVDAARERVEQPHPRVEGHVGCVHCRAPASGRRATLPAGMPLDFDLVGRPLAPGETSWSSQDALLYALAVGAGQDDPLAELQFTTENSQGIEQQVLPTFGVMVVQRGGPRRRLGDFDPAMLVHAEQALVLHRPLPVAGRARVTSTVTGIYDKGSGALVVSEATATDVESGELLVTTVSSAFIRGQGGFGGERGPVSTWQLPARSPDFVASAQTRPDQALLYRLCGDRNPLHSDPAVAARAGFPRPILHGLCTYGITGRLLLHGLCGSEPARFGSMQARFTRPVLPGARLTVSAWLEPESADGRLALFRTTDESGAAVIDHGELRFGQHRAP